MNPRYAVTFGKNCFVTVGDSGRILSSPDGMTWDNRGSGTTVALFGITYGNDMFIAVGDSGTILTSPATVKIIPSNRGIAPTGKRITISNNTLHYSMETEGNVTIRLFDLKGKPVKTLFNNRQPAGTYSAYLPTTLPSGSYILSFRTEQERIDRSIVVPR
jgi:hypothetical protein